MTKLIPREEAMNMTFFNVRRYLAVELRYCVRMYFAPFTAALRAYRLEVKRIERDRARQHG
jgi:hypothetical protein